MAGKRKKPKSGGDMKMTPGGSDETEPTSLYIKLALLRLHILYVFTD
jgi:hypothetical protein